MKKIIFIILASITFFGCSGKSIYTNAMDFATYNANLDKKTLIIDDNLSVTYFENKVSSKYTLLLVHGFGANKENWLSLTNEFDDEYHIVIPDLVGFGESSKPFDINYTLQKQSDLLFDFTQKLGIKSIIIVGNSMGGGISLIYASDHKVEKLILIDAFGIKAEDSVFDKLSIDEKKELLFNVCSKEKMKNLLTLSMDKPMYITDGILEYLAEVKCKNAKLEIHQSSGFLDNNMDNIDDLSLVASKITVPTLILWGAKDKMLNVKNSLKFQEKIKNSKLIIFKNSGHVPMYEESELSAKAIEDFVK